MTQTRYSNNVGYISAMTVYVVAVVVSMIAIIFLVWLAFFNGNNNVKVTKPAATQTSKNTSPKSQSTSTGGTASGSTSTNSAEATSSNGTASQSMPNTGPGDVVGIFVIVSAVAALGKYLQLRHKILQS